MHNEAEGDVDLVEFVDLVMHENFILVVPSFMK